MPTWPDEPFVLLAEKGKFELGSFTADSWSIGEGNVLYCSPADGSHPVQLRVTMQIGDLILANDGDMGPMTYRIVPASAYRRHAVGDLTLPGDQFGILGKLAALLRFLDRGPLALTIGSLEQALAGCDREDILDVLDEHVLTPAALEAACVAREKLRRLSDVIHAAAIALILPQLLEPGERVTHTSLAVRTDLTDPFDLQTDRRVARFQLAMWDGADAKRRRLLVRDPGASGPRALGGPARAVRPGGVAASIPRRDGRERRVGHRPLPRHPCALPGVLQRSVGTYPRVPLRPGRPRAGDGSRRGAVSNPRRSLTLTATLTHRLSNHPQEVAQTALSEACRATVE